VRPNKSDLYEFLVIVYLGNQAICVVNDLKPCTTVPYHLRSREIAKHVLAGLGLPRYRLSKWLLEQNYELVGKLPTIGSGKKIELLSPLSIHYFSRAKFLL